MLCGFCVVQPPRDCHLIVQEPESHSSLGAARRSLQSWAQQAAVGYQRLRAWRWQWAVALPAAGILYVLLLIPFTPSISDIRKAKLEQPALVLTADGKEMAIFKRSNRQWVGLEQVSPPVIQALIATEDHRFYEHHGMDWWRTAGSVVHTLRGNTQGGSTLTQQLARNLYPEEIGRATSLNRKLKEAITAFKIEALYSKDEILETYLNTVPFLYNAWGIEMAARTYFDKSAAKLSVIEAATLVGMLKGTSYYNPVRNPERAVQRRNTVLSQMAKRQVLPAQELAALQKRPLRLNFERQEAPAGMAPHFAQQVRKWLIDWADSQGYNIYTDGLVVHTTLDARMQNQALQAVRKHSQTLQGIANTNWSKGDGWRTDNPLVHSLVRESTAYASLLEKGQSAQDALKTLLADKAFMQQLRQDKTRIEAGFIAMDPATAAIRAWVGSRDFAVDAFDHVQQARRQPGSTFKPFVYGAALQEGLLPDDTRVDEAVEYQLPGGEVWRPTDAAAPTGQSMPLRDALAYSKNTITAQLMDEVGPAKVARLARNLGVRASHLDAVPALALGASPVTLLEMTNAYGSLVRGGQYRSPMMVTRIEDRSGKVLAEFAPYAAEKAMDEDDSYALIDMLRGVVDKGTGRAIRQRYGIKDDVAGKTGTTQNNADGWFILMHPHLVAGAWAGFNDGRITLRSDHWGQGARSALPMVGEFTAQALRNQGVDRHVRFVEPDTSRWWSELSHGVRSRWESLWTPDREDKPALPVPAAPKRPQSAAEAPKATVGESEREIEESIPAFPLPAEPAVPPVPVQGDALDTWMEQWTEPTAPSDSAPDYEALPPAVVGQPPESI
ncbi:MAG: transglycosylase domain-containing protein [Comamonas sp.]|nr:transglycosylase domain-containing protein [Comamonas sp.]